MNFRVSHLTKYSYDRPVFLEPHTIRLRPRADPYQRVVDFHIDVVPRPSRLAAVLDPHGNSVYHAWFDALTSSLLVNVDFTVETLLTDPFDYMLLEGSLQELPIEYSPEVGAVLAAYRPGSRGVVGDFARSVAMEVEQQTIVFLTTLNRRLFETCEVEVREEGAPQPPEETLATRKGACRDLTVLFVECCRSLGLASRFVSGYHEGDTDADRHHMHAWAEVYLPGGGWRGFDPTHGLAVADRHVAVAAAAIPEAASPISGKFRGTGARGSMETDLRVDVAT